MQTRDETLKAAEEQVLAHVRAAMDAAEDEQRVRKDAESMLLTLLYLLESEGQAAVKRIRESSERARATHQEWGFQDSIEELLLEPQLARTEDWLSEQLARLLPIVRKNLSG